MTVRQLLLLGILLASTASSSWAVVEIPDGGATGVMLGLGLLALGFCRKFKK